MDKVLLVIITISLLPSCNSLHTKTVEQTGGLEFIHQPDSILVAYSEKNYESNKSKCTFSDPDTSVAGIKIRNTESTLNVLGKHTKLDGDSNHIFYSLDKKQLLGLTVHPGDNYNQVSIFKISYSNISNQNLQQLDLQEFQTEKGIKLGINKSQIIERLGACYMAVDSTKNVIELCYRLELPHDSKTELLKRHNLPMYYATYKLTNDKLESIEFGFEYP